MRDDDKKKQYEKPRILVAPAFDEERYDQMMEDRMADAFDGFYEEDSDDGLEDEFDECD